MVTREPSAGPHHGNPEKQPLQTATDWTGSNTAWMWSFWPSSTNHCYSFTASSFLLFLFSNIDSFCFVFFLSFFCLLFSQTGWPGQGRFFQTHREPVTGKKVKPLLFNYLSAAQESQVLQHPRGLWLGSRTEARGVRNREESHFSLLFLLLFISLSPQGNWNRFHQQNQ